MGQAQRDLRADRQNPQGRERHQLGSEREGVGMSAPFIVAVPKKKPLHPGTVGRNALDLLATVTE